MAEWLKKVIEEADRQFRELPEWKRASTEQFPSNPRVEESSTTNIREPFKPQEKLR